MKKHAANVGSGVIHQVHTGKELHHCHEAVVVTTAPGYTKQAIRNARKLDIKLIGRRELEALIHKYMKEEVDNDSFVEDNQ